MSRPDSVRVSDREALRVLLALLAVTFVTLVIRTAWMSDDSFITLRTIDNAVNGYGLRWNVAERVQTYTHPLWMLVLLSVYVFTREPYFTTIAVSVALSLAAFLVMVMGVARARPIALVVACALLLSRSVIEYSTSGLENPLTHLLLALFLLVLFGSPATRRSVQRLTLLTSLLLLTRDDLVLLVGPALALAVWHTRPVPWRAVAIGLAPLAAWKLFSLVYYGFLVPNTAFAKLSTGIPLGEAVSQGLRYVLDHAEADPVSLVVWTTGIVLALGSREWRHRALGAGMLLSLIYVVAVGGDFMSGRFFTPLVIVALGVVATREWPSVRRWWPAAVVPLLAIGVIEIVAAWQRDIVAGPTGSTAVAIHPTGISDERRFYQPYTGIARQTREAGVWKHPWLAEARGLLPSATGPTTLLWGAIGFVGYYFGPEVHTIDYHGLGDPLLARLPSSPRWRPGHYARALPDGYPDAVRGGPHALTDQGLSHYYEQLYLITRAPIWNGARWRAIVGFNLGRYDALLDAYIYPSKPADQLMADAADGLAWDAPGVVPLPDGRLQIVFAALVSGRSLEVTVSGNDAYTFDLMRGDQRVSRQHLEPRAGVQGALVRARFELPASVGEFDRVRVTARRGDFRYSLGHLRVGP